MPRRALEPETLHQQKKSYSYSVLRSATVIRMSLYLFIFFSWQISQQIKSICFTETRATRKQTLKIIRSGIKYSYCCGLTLIQGIFDQASYALYSNILYSCSRIFTKCIYNFKECIRGIQQLFSNRSRRFYVSNRFLDICEIIVVQYSVSCALFRHG